MKPLAAVLAACITITWLAATASAAERTLAVREGKSASLAGGVLYFQVLKIRGYSIDIRVGNERRLLRLGQTLVPEGADCMVRFKKISPETRIARFVTDCPGD